MPSISFTAYDFFGYLASGFIFIISVVYIGTNKWLFTYEYNFLSSIFLIIIAYVAGHIIAIFAKILYERLIVGLWLKRPEENLFREDWTGWRRWLVGEYFEPFPKPLALKILDKAKTEEIGEDPKALSRIAYARARTKESEITRADIFLSLYGFCRNSSFALLLSIVVLSIGGWSGEASINAYICALAAFTSIALFHRYLKFLRLYAYELFLSYLESSGENEKAKKVPQKPASDI